MGPRRILPVLVALLGAGLWFALTRPDAREGAAERPEVAASQTNAAPPSDPVPRPSAADDAPSSARAPDAHAGPPARGDASGVEPTKPPSAAPAIALRGRVLDVRGGALAGVDIAIRGVGEALATSDGAGSFAFELPAGETEVVLVARASSGFATVRACHVERHDVAADHMLIAARAIALAGTVVDEAGIVLAGVEVEAAVPDALLTAFPFARDRMERVRHRTTTDARGAFALAGAPYVEAARVVAAFAGYTSADEPLPSSDRDDLLLTLERPRAPEGLDVSGFVYFEDGSPAPHATVRFRSHAATSAADGSFVFRIPANENAPEDEADFVALAAGLEGFTPALVPRFDRVLIDAAPYAPAPLELFLGGPAPSISGRVLDGDGNGLAEWRVQIRGGVPVSTDNLPIENAESLAGYVDAQTGDDGAFELSGLLDRDYEVWAYHASTLQAVEAAAVPAGTHDLELRPDRGQLFERVEGVVVSRAGQPLPSAHVGATRVTARSKSGLLSVSGSSATTDENGRFVLLGVPREGVRLSVGGSDVVPESYVIGASDDPTALTLSVARRCHFQLRVRGDVAGLNVSLLDATDKALPIYAFQSNGWMSTPRRQIEETGTTPVLAVSEDAKVLVLLRGADEVLRHSVLFLADGVTTIDVEAP